MIKNKRNWYRWSGFTAGCALKKDKAGYTRIHDFFHGFGLVSKSGKSVSWDSGWKPPTKREAAKLIKQFEENSKKPFVFPVIRKSFPALLIEDIVNDVQPMQA